MKKIIAMLLALIMVLGLSTTVFAADGDDLDRITVSGADTHTYNVYQVFTGSVSADGTKLSDIELGANGTLGLAASATDEQKATALKNALEALVAANGKSDAEKAVLAASYVDLDTTPVGTVKAGSPLDVVPGYYLLVDATKEEDLIKRDEDGNIISVETKSLYILQIIHDVTIDIKYDKVTSEKKVYDINDSTGETLDSKDSADYDIGDRVKFTLTATMPADYDKYEDYYYLAFHDTCSAGLTFDAQSQSEMVVKVDGTKITTGYKIVVPGANSTFDVVFENAKTVDAIKAGSVVTVDYTALLNQNAVAGKAGNKNEMKLEFSNDPNYVLDPDDDPNTPPPPPPPPGVTPPDTVIVFTFDIDLNKVDENEELLKGASFTLYKQLFEEPDEDSNVTYTTETDDKGVTTYWQNLGTIDGTDSSKFFWHGVDDGIYRLEETVTPSGYNTMDPIVFEITADHDLEGVLPELIELDGGTLDPVDENEDFVITADIRNLPGTELPSTGGVGTTMLYIVGSVLVLAAIVMLITKKRMANAE